MKKLSIIIASVLMSCVSNDRNQPFSSETATKAAIDTSVFALKDVNNFGALKKSLLSEGLQGFTVEKKGNLERYQITAIDRNIVIETGKDQKVPAGFNKLWLDGKKYSLTNDENEFLLIDNLRMYALKINGSNFLCIYSGYTPCNSYNCRNVRFNLFEINSTVNHLAFDEVFGDVDVFGDINDDGNLDILSIVFTENVPDSLNNRYDYNTITALTLKGNRLEELPGEKNKYFLNVRYDPTSSELSKTFNFKILEKQWIKM